MYYINVVLTVKNSADVPSVGEMLTECCRLSRQEPGCLRFEVYHSQSDETRYMLNEIWESEEAIDRHREGHAFTKIYQPQVLALATREGHVCTLVEPPA